MRFRFRGSFRAAPGALALAVWGSGFGGLKVLGLKVWGFEDFGFGFGAQGFGV